MKSRRLVAVLAAAMVLAGSVMAWAGTDGLQLVSSYPKDGQTGTSMENVGVKLEFNGTFDKAATQKADKKAVKLTDEDGKKVPTTVEFDGGEVLIVADTTDYTVLNNAEYTVTINGTFADDNGNTLGKQQTITFKTLNQKVSSYVNMAMMVVMFGGIMVVTMKQQKDQNEDKKEEKELENTFNPYKEAKKTGKSVQEVLEEEEKRKAKLEKKNKKKGIKTPSKKKEKIICADYLNNVYHVHAPAPIHKKRKK